MNFFRTKKRICYHTINLDDTQLLRELQKFDSFTYMPNSGNMGDMLIAAATLRWFDKNHLSYNRLKSPNESPKNFVYGGGGAWIHEWIDGLKIVMELMKKAERIVILPSSFDNVPEFVEMLDERFVVFCREKKSYEYLLKQETKAKILLDHDMAFRLEGDIFKNVSAPSRLKKSALSLRNAVKSLSKEVYLYRRDAESKGNYKTDLDLSNMLGWFSPYETTKDIDFAVSIMMEFLTHFETIYTDRLHVGISAAILGKKVILSDNSYGKLSGVFEQTLHFMPNVQLILSDHDLKEGSHK